MPQFSVLIPIIKSKFLATAIDSVLKQSYADFELVLYNDCSPDDVEAIVRGYSDSRITYYKGDKNLGSDDPSKTWNKLLSLASGQFICLLGDDDFLSLNYLEEIHKLIQKYPKLDIYRSRLKRVDEKNQILFWGEPLPEYETWEQMFYLRNTTNRIQSTSEFVLRKNTLLDIGGYVHFPLACGSDDATYLLLTKKNGIASTNNTFAFWRKSLLNISDNDSEESNKHKIKKFLTWQKKFLDSFFPSKISAYKLYQSIDTRFPQVASDITKKELESVKKELQRIYLSREWKICTMSQRLAKIFLPKGSLRRKIAERVWLNVKLTFRFTLKIGKKTKSTILLLIKRLSKSSLPKKNRNINTNSKKIIYIGHSYHEKTKSSDFFLNYLKQFFEVELILDESWLGQKQFPDLSFIDEKYLGVIFWQQLPNKEIYKNIKNDNIIFFPMFDAVESWDYPFWSNYEGLKIVNFSKTLHQKLKKLGFESIYVQYFPKPKDFISGNKKEVFFWQRLTKININTITKILGEENFKIHIHKAVDPNFKFVEPSHEDEKKFQITYSDWFKTKEEAWNLVKQRGIYVAPREFEGIGLSFLEAMAMGKAVIAVDNPTMNEYIEHNRTGYLFNLIAPKKIDLSNIDQVQKNTYQYICKGYQQWEKDKFKIIKFIKE